MGLLCSLLLLLLACTSISPSRVTDIGDGGFLSEQPCGPPCFWDITPNITREAQVIQVLQTQGLFQNCETFNNEAQSGYRGINCRFVVSVAFQLGTDIVSIVGFKPSSKLTVKGVISKYGNPDSVTVTASGLPEHPRTVMVLYYDKIYTNLVLTEQEGVEFEVIADTEIENIGYSDQADYNLSNRYAFKWNGYGKYQRHEPGE
jgi:hypothetical protein